MEEVLKLIQNYGLGIALAGGIFISYMKVINYLIGKLNKQLEIQYEVLIKLIDRFNRFEEKLDRIKN